MPVASSKRRRRVGHHSERPGSVTPEHVIKNLTGKRIAIRPIGDDPGRQLIIPPFGQRTIPSSEVDSYDVDSWKRQLLVTIEALAPMSSPSALVELPPIIAGYALLGAFASGMYGLLQDRDTTSLDVAAGFGALTVASMVATCAYGGRLGDAWGRMRRSTNIFLLVLIAAGLPLGSLVLEEPKHLATGQPRITMLILLFTGSVLPAALYFWFHRQKLPVMRENFLRDIVRLDPNVQTLADAETSYGGLIDDVYGRSSGPALGTQQHRSAAVAWGGIPILLVTVLFACLWTWALLGNLDQRVGDSPAPAALLSPNPDVVTFAFLGSYFFALNMLFRRYTRSDLSPKAYTHVCVRTITAIVGAWAVSYLPWIRPDDGKPRSVVLLLAFMIGIVPETGPAVIQDFLQSMKRLGGKIPSIQEDHPLSKLNGISLYDRAQLLEVGIENVESLAHNNLVDLMLWTRIPTSRLVDFVDQAVLYLHVQGPGPARHEDEAPKEGGALALLASYGIRTATDLERAVDLAQHPGQILGLLDESTERVQHLRVILDALEDDEWMVYLRNWRSQSVVVTPLASVDEFVTAAARGTRSVPRRPGQAPTTPTTGDNGSTGTNGLRLGPPLATDQPR